MKPTVLVDRAEAALDLGRSAEAARFAAEALALDPNDGDAKYALARAQRDQGRLDEAEATARDLLAQYPEVAWNHHLLGSVIDHRVGMAAKRQACAHYEQAYRLRPDDADLAEDYADAMRRTDRLVEAKRVAVAGLRESPDHVGLLRVRARLALKLDEPLVASRLSRRALALAPEDAEAHEVRAAVAFARDRYVVAERHELEALRLQPSRNSWVARQGIREARYMQSPWYVVSLVPVGLVFAPPWPWRALTMAVAAAAFVCLWPISGWAILANLIYFVAARTAICACRGSRPRGGPLG
ncbi:MAG: tetratricopeptide repeat protein [Planctomycetota bacterium]